MDHRISKLVGFGRIAEEEPDPETKQLHYDVMSQWDAYEHHRDSLITALGEALSEAYQLSQELVLHQAAHTPKLSHENVVEEWKRLTIQLERWVGCEHSEQLLTTLNRLVEPSDEAA